MFHRSQTSTRGHLIPHCLNDHPLADTTQTPLGLKPVAKTSTMARSIVTAASGSSCSNAVRPSAIAMLSLLLPLLLLVGPVTSDSTGMDASTAAFDTDSSSSTGTVSSYDPAPLDPAVMTNSPIPPAYPSVTRVFVGAQLVSLSKIDPLENQFTSDVHVTMVWRDPLLTDGTTNPNARARTVWYPRVQWTNGRLINSAIPSPLDRSIHTCPDEFLVTMGSGASSSAPATQLLCVFSSQRYTGTFASSLRLQDFPFDSQTLQLTLGSTVYDTSEMMLVSSYNAADRLAPSAGYDITEWEVRKVTATASNSTLGSQQQATPTLTWELTIERQPTSYLSKIILVVILNMLLGFGLFALSPNAVNRLQSTFSLFVALISMQWVLGSSAPRLPYMTRLDRFILFNFIFSQCNTGEARVHPFIIVLTNPVLSVFLTFYVQAFLYIYKTDQLSCLRFLGEDPSENKKEDGGKKDKEKKKTEGGKRVDDRDQKDEGDDDKPKKDKSKDKGKDNEKGDKDKSKPAPLPSALTFALPKLVLDILSRMQKVEQGSIVTASSGVDAAAAAKRYRVTFPLNLLVGDANRSLGNPTGDSNLPRSRPALGNPPPASGYSNLPRGGPPRSPSNNADEVDYASIDVSIPIRPRHATPMLEAGSRTPPMSAVRSPSPASIERKTVHMHLPPSRFGAAGESERDTANAEGSLKKDAPGANGELVHRVSLSQTDRTSLTSQLRSYAESESNADSTRSKGDSADSKSAASTPAVAAAPLGWFAGMAFQVRRDILSVLILASVYAIAASCVLLLS